MRVWAPDEVAATVLDEQAGHLKVVVGEVVKEQLQREGGREGKGEREREREGGGGGDVKDQKQPKLVKISRVVNHLP